jgi:hypothetical protein
VKIFFKELSEVLEAAPFFGNQRALALLAGINPGHLHRVLGKRADATPEFVGRLCGTLPTDKSARLLKAFLTDVIAETSKASRNPKMKGTWRRPTSDLRIKVACDARKN